MTTGFSLDPSYRRPADGPVLIAGSPLRLFRLGAAGVRVVEAIERGTDLPSGHERLTRRLVDAGAIHPTADAAPVDPSALTIVVPALGGRPEFAPQRCRTIVVDDGSPVPITVPVIRPGDPLLRVVRLDANQGPAAARNAGLREVTTPYVAFVDTDVDVDEDTLLALAGQLDASGDALAAPRVCAHAASDDASVFQRFEQAGSPLDLGPVAARVAPTTRVSYVPAASIVCRVDAIRAVGGFDEALRYGEDVDLVWRLVAAGHTVRYDPSVVAHHDTRPTVAGWLGRKFAYGTGGAVLARRHGDHTAVARLSPAMALAAGALLVRRRWSVPVAAACLARSGSVLSASLPEPVVTPALMGRLSVRGLWWSLRQESALLLRHWWPAALVAATASRSVRRAIVTACVVDVAAAASEGVCEGHVAAFAGRRLDDLAYGGGLWWGALRARDLRALAVRWVRRPGGADRLTG